MALIKRLIAASGLSALSVAPLFLLLNIFTGGVNTSYFFVVLVMTPVFAFVGVLLVGLPVHAFLHRRQLSHPFYYALPGFLFPFVLVSAARPFGDDDVFGIAWQALLMGLFGVTVALVFRWIALSGATNNTP